MALLLLNEIFELLKSCKIYHSFDVKIEANLSTNVGAEADIAAAIATVNKAIIVYR